MPSVARVFLEYQMRSDLVRYRFRPRAALRFPKVREDNGAYIKHIDRSVATVTARAHTKDQLERTKPLALPAGTLLGGSTVILKINANT